MAIMPVRHGRMVAGAVRDVRVVLNSEWEKAGQPCRRSMAPYRQTGRKSLCPARKTISLRLRLPATDAHVSDIRPPTETSVSEQKSTYPSRIGNSDAAGKNFSAVLSVILKTVCGQPSSEKAPDSGPALPHDFMTWETSDGTHE